MSASLADDDLSGTPGVDVLYEDNHLLAVNKPPGLLTQASGRDEDSLEARARAYVKQARNKRGEAFLHVVHRLDRVASGVVLCATTGKALKRLNAQIQDRAVRKVYHAVVEGRPLQDKAVLEHWLVHARHHARIGRAADEGARKARLRYQVLRQHADTCLLEVELETGRYHQIRAQLGAIGCPILGDARYGATQAIDAPAAAGRTIALHHRELSLDHPVGGSPLTIEAAYPDGWPGH